MQPTFDRKAAVDALQVAVQSLNKCNEYLASWDLERMELALRFASLCLFKAAKEIRKSLDERDARTNAEGN